jgi:site-specific DNA recombinase
MAQKKKNLNPPPTPGWAVYLRTSSDENQKPEMSRARQRYAIEKNVLERSEMPVYEEYIDVLTGTTAQREAYQRLLEDARMGKFSHVIVERADRFGRNDTEALRAIDELHEFGVAVRFANQPDLDPMDPDDRVIVTLSFTLARRESALLGLRVQGGHRAKREQGGFNGLAPDGYINVTGKTSGEAKRLNGRHEHWIEIDPERAPIIRYAWDLLLEDRLTLEEICEELHKRGYRHQSGRPFIIIQENGKRRANINTLARMFRCWTYAGWVTSKVNNLPPKTIRGDWEPIVTTEEFERGLMILDHRTSHRVPKRKHDYLLSGLMYYEEDPSQELKRLSGSTSNSGRNYGGSAYYCISKSKINFLCKNVDAQVDLAMIQIQVDEKHISSIRAAYTKDIANKLGHLKPDDRTQLELSLKAIDDEEARAARLYVAGKFTESIWDSMWREWQDRRHAIRTTLDEMRHKQETHISNLDLALSIIAKIGIVYNELERDDKKELLRQMIEKVIINREGQIRIELRAPFTYLRLLNNEISGDRTESLSVFGETKTDQFSPVGLSGPDSSSQVSSNRGVGTRTPNPSLWRRMLCQLSYTPRR